MRQTLMEIHDRLLAAWGPQHWWPADTPFEVALGAVLTQNTNWRNVERAIDNLKQAGALQAARILALPDERLQSLIRPAGFFRQTAARLSILADFWQAEGDASGLRAQAAPELRRKLLALHGIGPETADSILLYALDKPAFVIDAYTRRIFHRLGLCAPDADYHALQSMFIAHLPAEVPLFNEYHALLVALAKRHCRVRPDRAACPLRAICPAGSEPRVD